MMSSKRHFCYIYNCQTVVFPFSPSNVQIHLRRCGKFYDEHIQHLFISKTYEIH